MKDEEMAEEYAESVIGCGDGYYEWTDVFNGFLAGLKAGRPQWQEVGEQIPTSEQRPPENKMYLIAIKGNGLAIAYFNGKHWETKYNLGDFGHCVETVIAWCEIPTFDKEYK